MNTFHPYFYGDRIDLGSITDPLIKSTILGFISNFGQVPKQVSTAAHSIYLALSRVGSACLGKRTRMFYPVSSEGRVIPGL